MLRTSPTTSRATLIAFALVAAVGVGAAALVLAGNPGNMGLCGACFLRDGAGALGFFARGPKIFRPELAGLVLGAFVMCVLRRRAIGRSGSFAVSRFLLGALMAMGSLVFLGCPFRLLQRLGGGDLNAAIGAAGLIAGAGLAVLFERRGYSIGKTSPSPLAVGLLPPLVFAGLLALHLQGSMPFGPGWSQTSAPAHAPSAQALFLALGAGMALSATGFCAITAARQVFLREKRMLVAALTLMAAYGLVQAFGGRFQLGFDQQPIAHQEHLWNFLAVTLVGLCGGLAGGCPVRLLVLSGEGNGDAFAGVMGIVVGGAISHNFDIVSSATGTTAAGRTVVVFGLVLALAYGGALVISARRTRP